MDDVTHVINHTIPDDDKTYLHRAGRTGRAGKTGIAVTFVDWDDLHKWALINRALEFGKPEPVETYSSSPHLYEDLNIPAGTKGRLVTAPRTQTIKTQDAPASRNGSARGTRTRTRPAGRGPAQAEGDLVPAEHGHPTTTDGPVEGGGTTTAAEPSTTTARRPRSAGVGAVAGRARHRRPDPRRAPSGTRADARKARPTTALG